MTVPSQSTVAEKSHHRLPSDHQILVRRPVSSRLTWEPVTARLRDFLDGSGRRLQTQSGAGLRRTSMARPSWAPAEAKGGVLSGRSSCLRAVRLSLGGVLTV
jgi:hypothetical protein